METQIVRLDAPYNLICNPDREFGLHIATLIVSSPEKGMKKPEIKCYPVVEVMSKPGGEVWSKHELSECLAICRQNQEISLSVYKNVMEYFYEKSEPYIERMPWLINLAFIKNGIKMLPIKNKKRGQKEYHEAELIFKEDKAKDTCMVFSSRNSDLFFFASFTMGKNKKAKSDAAATKSLAIWKLSALRNAYWLTMMSNGLKQIVFTTADKDYQDFVDELNKN